MKKILAFILATFMVLSLVPASSFAAFDVACPSNHTMVNCETKYITTVPATCTTHGYDIYNCVKCGAEVLDNFVNPVEHTWISGADSKHVNKAATCTTPGYEWVKKCKYCPSVDGLIPCDKTCGDTSCKLYKKVTAVEHNYVATGSGIGCEAEYKCSLCGDIAYKNTDGEFVGSAQHDWNYAEAEVTTAPSWTNGTFVKGEAVVKCTVEGCPAEKTVEITSMACQHYAATIVKAYADATCFAAGSLQVIECRDCHKYFVDVNKDGEINDDDFVLTEKKNGSWTNKETKDLKHAVIAQLKHTKPAEGFSSVANCVGIYTCVNCNTVQSEVSHTGLANDNGEIEYPATCLNPGYNFQYCTACNQNITGYIPPTNHEGSKLEFTVKPSCSNDGATYTICTSESCTAPRTFIEDANKDAYDKVSAKVPAAFITEGAITKYYVRVIGIKDVKPADASKHSIKYYDVTNGRPGVESTTMPTTTCAGYKIVEISCAYGCTNTVEFVPAGDHVEYVSKKYANCNKGYTDGLGKWLPQFTERVVYACKNCTWTSYEDVPVSFKYQYATEEELKYYHGAIFYEANANYELESKPRMANHIVDLESNLTLPTCTTEGLKTYACTECNANYYVTDGKIPHTPDKNRVAVDSDYTGGEAATCTKAGKWASFKCAHCNNIIIKNKYTGKQEIVTDLTIKPHGSTLKKVDAKSDADTCNVDYWQCTAENCGKTFTNWDAKTEFDTSVENHKWVVLQQKVVATCNKNGKYEIKYCSNKDCRRIEVNVWFEIEGKLTDEINIYVGTRNYKSNAYKDTEIKEQIATLDANGAWVKKTFKITAAGKLSGDYGVALPMLDHKAPLAGSHIASKVPAKYKAATNFTSEKRNASGDHTTPGYISMQCNYCSYEYFTDYVAASKDHVNVDGQIITTECINSTITDRFCIFCQADVKADHKYTTDTPITAPSTCVQSGYEYKLCKLCGHREIVKVYAPSDAFHSTPAFEEFKVEIGKQSNYAQVGTEYSVSCALCKKNIGEAQKPTDVKDAGLEILLNADTTTIIPGSTVKVTVSLASLKGVNVWALAFPVSYDANVYEFVGYEWNTAESAFQTFAVTDVAGGYQFDDISGAGKTIYYTDGVFKKAGVLHIVANADEEATIKGEQVLVTLEFKVISATGANTCFEIFDRVNDEVNDEDYRVYTGGTYGKKLSAVIPELEGSFWGDYYELLTMPTVKEIKVEVIDANGAVVNANFNKHNKTETIKVAEFLDLDNENGITLADAYKLYSLIYNNEYDVRADANYDGKVDGRDLSILYAIYTGVVTVETLITPDAELPAGFEAWMGAK